MCHQCIIASGGVYSVTQCITDFDSNGITFGEQSLVYSQRLTARRRLSGDGMQAQWSERGHKLHIAHTVPLPILIGDASPVVCVVALVCHLHNSRHYAPSLYTFFSAGPSRGTTAPNGDTSSRYRLHRDSSIPNR